MDGAVRRVEVQYAERDHEAGADDASARAVDAEPGKAADGKETGTGFGWRIAQISGERVCHHGGDAMGGRAFLLLRPEHGLAVAVTCNLSFARIAEANAMALSQPFVA